MSAPCAARTGPRARPGFTLAEVVVSAVILAIAAAVVIPYLADVNRRKNAEDTRDLLAFLLETSNEFAGPHLGAFTLTSHP